MTPEQSERYARHVLMPQIGEAGQARLLDARVLIVGLGGLGSPASMYLAASGVGRLALCDYDFVELSNLQRQIVHTTADVGRDKVESARDTLAALNPDVGITTLPWALDEEELEAEVAASDVVVDACDNFTTRFTMNAACLRTGTPLVSAAAVRMEAHVTVFDPREPSSPCYRCLYVPDAAEGEVCAQVGVLAPLLGIAGSIQAVETMKQIVGFGETLVGRLLVLDALAMEWRTLRLRKDPGCPVCAGEAEALRADELAAVARR